MSRGLVKLAIAILYNALYNSFMAGPFTDQELREIHAKLKAKQDALEPCLTFSMMQELLNYDSPNSVTNVMQHLVRIGLAKKVPWRGSGNRYRFLEADDNE